MKIRDLTQAEIQLQKFVPNVSKLIGDNMSLDRISRIMNLVGNPQDNLNIIHVAGTSGKTSTCYYISAILQQSCKKTVLTVSPHINSITERIQINGNNISDKLFCSYLGEFLDIIDDSQIELSYFELLIGLAFWVSSNESIDYLILETGMGGKYDASNISKAKDKVCVITDIGFDHMHVLGDTIELIAEQKAGIIHDNNTVFAYKQSSEVNDVLNKTASSKKAKVNFLDQKSLYMKTKLNLDGLALYQRRNWLLAEEVCRYLSKRDKFKLILPDPKKIIIPGRMEILNITGKNVLFDGAHNQQKMHTFVASYKSIYKNRKACVLIALKEGKEYKDVIDELKPIVSKLIITRFKTSQDLPAVSEDPETLQKYAISLGLKTEINDVLSEAVKSLINDNNDNKIVTGSFYLISQIKSYLKL